MGYGEQIGSFVSAIGQVGSSVKEVSHAIGELSKAMGAYSHAEGASTKAYGACSHAEGHSSLSCRQPTGMMTLIKMSIVRKPMVKFDETKSVTFDVKNWAFNRGLY